MRNEEATASPLDDRLLAYARAEGRCECTRPHFSHPKGRCEVGLSEGWMISKLKDGPDSTENYEVLCVECDLLKSPFGR